MHHVVHEPHLILSASQMRAAEQRAMLEGISGGQMMHHAGMLAAQEIMARFRPRPTLVLCGPGNNGGDGFVIAEALRVAGWPVEVASLLPAASLKEDAKIAAELYRGEVVPLHAQSIRPEWLIVDALFGTGLERPVEGDALHALALADTLECTIVAVDVPSGIHTDSGIVLGAAAHAMLTLTFGARKPAHLLYPGRDYAGEVVVVDIGIAQQIEAVARQQATTLLLHENAPELWRYSLRWPEAHMHKYSRGSAVVAGGGIHCTGAARLAAIAALRAGAGAVTITTNKEALPVYAAQLTAVMTRVIEDAAAFGAFLAEDRHRVALIGPGHGVGERTRDFVLAALRSGKPCVLDADALTSFSGLTESLFSVVQSPLILTPHEGEFAAVFPALAGDKITRTSAAAKQSKAVVLLKGADTVIASPDGRAAVNVTATPDLATAGSGDVLAGIITGLLATGMPAFEAACAGAWMHGVIGAKLGLGMIAEDMPLVLPEVLKYVQSL